MANKWQDPRTGTVYTDKQIKRIKGKFLANGLHKQYLQPYSEENSVKKVVEPKIESKKESVVKEEKELKSSKK